MQLFASKRWPAWLKAVLASSISLVLADLALSLWIGASGLVLDRPLPPFGAITHPRQRTWLDEQHEELASPRLIRGPAMFDRELGWTIRANYRSPDGGITCNALGARGAREYALSPPAGTLRIVCAGDSFTWCDEVEDAASWEVQLEALEPSVEAINLGVSAYGTDQALLRFERDGRDLGAQIACIGLQLENIGRNVNCYRPLWYPSTGGTSTKPRFVLEKGRLRLVPQPFASQAEMVAAVEDGTVLDRVREHEYWIDTPDLGVLRHSSLARIGGAWFAHRARDVRRLWLDEEGEPRRVTVALLERFRDTALANGSRVALVLILPRETDVAGLVREKARYWSGLIAELDAVDIPFVDVGPALAEAWSEAEARTDLLRLFERGHLSAAGNAIVTRSLDSWLRERGFLGPR